MVLALEPRVPLRDNTHCCVYLVVLQVIHSKNKNLGRFLIPVSDLAFNANRNVLE